MKIHSVKLENFMLFDRQDAEFSPNVNIICGENSAGKTASWRAFSTLIPVPKRLL